MDNLLLHNWFESAILMYRCVFLWGFDFWVSDTLFTLLELYTIFLIVHWKQAPRWKNGYRGSSRSFSWEMISIRKWGKQDRAQGEADYKAVLMEASADSLKPIELDLQSCPIWGKRAEPLSPAHQPVTGPWAFSWGGGNSLEQGRPLLPRAMPNEGHSWELLAALTPSMVEAGCVSPGQYPLHQCFDIWKFESFLIVPLKKHLISLFSFGLVLSFQ